ncbi:LysE family translocator [Haloferula sp. BvORR071]|uniref:LysE family translocator n=1 Tax=Haloferula sp. BvORR071 TaxID=1396141 RepID=UPI00055297A1|nr:LysE family translocator [Haloferula sp. BvORR071]
MFGIQYFGVFLLSGFLLNLTPGPDNFYILGRSMAQGRGAGVASALGIGAGALVHTSAAALGLSAIIAASATAFFLVKLAGAAYLIYLGIRMMRSRASSDPLPASFSTSGFWPVFRQGLLTNVLNPKVALFFLAFMPQFIRQDSPSKFAAFLVLGLCFVFTGTLWCLFLAWSSAWVGERLRKSPGFSTLLNRVAGGLFVFLGVRLVATR